MQLNFATLFAGFLALAPNTLASSSPYTDVAPTEDPPKRNIHDNFKPPPWKRSVRDVASEGIVKIAMARQAAADLIDKRAGPCRKVPNGVPQNAFANCCLSLSGKTLSIKSIETGKTVPDIRLKGLPYPCISAAPWFDGIPNSGPAPFACGDDCLQWTGLSNTECTNAYNNLA